MVSAAWLPVLVQSLLATCSSSWGVGGNPSGANPSSCDCRAATREVDQLKHLLSEAHAKEAFARKEMDAIRTELSFTKGAMAEQQAQATAAMGQDSKTPWSTEQRLDFFSSLTMSELEVLGELFMGQKVSKIVMNASTAAATGYDHSLQNKTSSAAGLATLVLTVPTSHSEVSSSMLKASTVEFVGARMDRWGVAALQAVLAGEECNEFAKYVMRGVLNPTYGFGDVSAGEFRKDYPLPFDETSNAFFQRVLKIVGPVLKDRLGEEARLTEFSAMASFPKAAEQPLHPDSRVDNFTDFSKATVFSVFVYLSDVEENMAALDVLPLSHTHFHFMYPGEIEMLHSAPLIRMAVPQGSIVIMDSNLYHRGSSNDSEKTRLVFYFSFASTSGELPRGPTYSLRRHLVNRITLQDVLMNRALKIAKDSELHRTSLDVETDLEDVAGALKELESIQMQSRSVDEL